MFLEDKINNCISIAKSRSKCLIYINFLVLYFYSNNNFKFIFKVYLKKRKTKIDISNDLVSQ